MTAILRPSNAPRWGNCAGSYVLQQAYPDDEESPAAREGTAAHYWVTEALQDRLHPVGALAPNGHPIDAEMIDNGKVMLQDVQLTHALASPTATLRCEQKLTAHGLVHPLNEGTPDVYMCDSALHQLIIWDYKYGHRDVDPFGNLQGLDYIACVFESFELTREDVKGWDVRFRIVQPRNFRAEPVREWKMLGWQAWDAIDKLAAAAEMATTPGAPTKTGPWCRDCSAYWVCEAALKREAAAIDTAGSSNPQEPSNLALAVRLKHLREAKKAIEAATTSLEEVALSKIRTGAQIPMWTIGHGDARERWTVPADQVIIMGEMLGADLAKPVAAITPNQARQAGVDATVIKAYSERPTGAAKLVLVDETAAAKAFSS